MHLNKVIIIGSVVRDPEIRFAGASQTPTSDLRLACVRSWKNAKGEKKEETLFVDVVAWGRQAEMAVQHLRKGRTVGVEGRLQAEEYMDAGGKRCQRISICADRIIFMPVGDGKSEAEIVAAAAEGAVWGKNRTVSLE